MQHGVWCRHEYEQFLPPEYAAAIAEAGGLNIYGDPNFKLAWGWARKCWVAGEWDTGRVEARWEPKYWPKFERWHVEMWCPAEAYGGPAKWREMTSKWLGLHRVDELGPYPASGDWEQVRALDDSGFLQLNFKAIEAMVSLVEFSRRMSHAERKAMRYHYGEKSEKAFEQQADSAVQDSGRAFHGQPFVSMAGK